MKKGFLIFLMGIVSFLGINTVSADTSNYTYYLISENFSFEENINFFNSYKDILSKLYDGLYADYLTNYSDIYPYYHIGFDSGGGNLFENSDKVIYAYMYMYSSVPTTEFLSSGDPHIIPDHIIQYEYNTISSSFILPIKDYYIVESSNGIFDIYYFYSNFDLILTEDIIITTKPGNKSYTFNTGDVFPTAQDLFNLNIISSPNGNNSIYTTIDLNQYSYVILTLKDYTPRSTFYSPGYYQGQLCITPVFNYGTEEKKDYISGWQAPPCTDYKESYTYHELIIKEEDIINHGVLYLTGYDSTKSNLVKVDASTFDITYITSDNENSPNVIIGGKNYNTLPYSSLTDTSVLTQQNGIDSTWTCAKYDTDCFLDSSGIDIDNLFSNPLQTLESVWSAITSIFKLIAEFILLLPPIMQAFLYLAFGVGIALGIIKILL